MAKGPPACEDARNAPKIDGFRSTRHLLALTGNHGVSITLTRWEATRADVVPG